MLTWFRARLVAWTMVVLCSFTAVDTLSAVHELECGDELAEGFALVHIAGSHAVAAARQGDQLGHCVICHWLQSFRSGGIRSSRHLLAQKPAPPRTIVAVQSTRTAARLDVPSRAPPA